MNPLSEFLQGYWHGMADAVQIVKANAAMIGSECGRASLYGLVLVSVLVAAWGVWAANCRLAGMFKGKKAWDKNPLTLALFHEGRGKKGDGTDNKEER